MVVVRLAEPAWLIVLVFVPLPWIWEWSRPRLAWPTLAGFRRAPRGWAGWPRGLPPLLRSIAVGCVAVALARPQTVAGQTRIAARGVAIVVALDQSSSMNTRDFPSERGPIARLEAARRTFEWFVRQRPDDLIGLVAFANYPNRECPPTLDHERLIASATRLKTARPGDDGTNIGDAVAWALGDLAPASPARKVLVLLTDGRNEPAVGARPPLDPEEAARLARELGVTLHTIAIGRADDLSGRIEPTIDPASPERRPGPNFALLERMAEIGGGRAFSAADARSLADVFAEIDRLEKSRVTGTIKTRYQEHFAPWVALAIGALVLDRALASGRLRRLP